MSINKFIPITLAAIFLSSSLFAEEIRVPKRINQSFYDDATIRVKKELELDQYEGYRLKRIKVVGYTTKRGRVGQKNSQITLRINRDGQSKTNYLYGGEKPRRGYGDSSEPQIDKKEFYFEDGRNILGEDINRIRLDVEGETYIKKIVAFVEERRRKKAIVLDRTINSFFDEDQFLPVKKEFNLRERQEHNGRKMIKVVIVAEKYNADRAVYADLMVNGERVDSVEVPYWSDEIELELERGENVLGKDLRRVQVHFSDEVYVGDAFVYLSKRKVGDVRPGPGPRPDPRPINEIDRSLQYVLHGSSSIFLANMISAGDRSRNVESVTLYGRGLYQGARVQLCVGQRSRRNCEKGQMYNTHASESRTFQMGGGTLGDIQIFTNQSIRFTRAVVRFSQNRRR